MKHLVIVCVLILLLTPAAQNPQSAAGDTPTTTPCTLVSAADVITCYPLTTIARILRRLHGGGLDPSPAVVRTTGLPLSQLATARKIVPRPSKRVTALLFVYGQLPASGGPEDPSPAIPKWLFVTERTSRVSGVHGVQLGQTLITGNVTPTPTTPPTVRVWWLTENLPYHCLNILAQSNEDKAVMQALGRALQARASRHRQTPDRAPRC